MHNKNCSHGCEGLPVPQVAACGVLVWWGAGALHLLGLSSSLGAEMRVSDGQAYGSGKSLFLRLVASTARHCFTSAQLCAQSQKHTICAQKHRRGRKILLASSESAAKMTT